MSTAGEKGKRTVKVPRTMHRNFELELEDAVGTRAEGGEGEARVYPLSFSSELPVRRWGWDIGEYDEVLSHDPADVDLSRAKNGLPLIKVHGWDMHFGSVNEITIDEKRKRLRGVASFSSIPLGQEQETLLREGHTKGVSVGYNILSMKPVTKDKKTGIPTYRCAWLPYEVSTAPIPADPKVGFGRSQAEARGRAEDLDLVEFTIEEPCGGGRTMGDEEKGTTTPSPTTGGAAPPAPAQGRDRGAEIAEIYELAHAHGLGDRAAEWVKRGLTPNQVGRQILEAKRTQGPAQPPAETLEGMPAKDRSRYSVQRALRMVYDRRQGQRGAFDGLEGEIHEELTRQRSNHAADHGGIFIPWRLRTQEELLQQRTMGTMEPTGGATLVGQQTMPDMIDVLRNRALTLVAGARLYPGLQGVVIWNKATSDPTVYFMDENPSSGVTQSNPAYGYVTMSPKTMMGESQLPRQLLVMTSIDMEAELRQRLGQSHALKFDWAGLHGKGTDKQPTGIYSADGVLVHAVDGVPDLTDVTTMPAKVADQNADLGTLSWMTTPLMAGVLKRTQVVSGQAAMLWEGNFREGNISGYPARATNQISKTLGAGANEHGLLFANWNDLAFGIWGNELEVVVDEVTQANKAQIKVTTFSMMDAVVLRGESFCKGTGALLSA